MTRIPPRPSAGHRQPSRRLLGRIEVAGEQRSARLVRVLTLVAPPSPGGSPIPETTPSPQRPSLPPGAKLTRPATLPTLGRKGRLSVKAGEAEAGARAQPPRLPDAVRAHLATHVPEALAEALYDVDEGPQTSAGKESTLEMLTCHAPDTHTTYLITTPEGRLDSSAKRRRWAVALPGDGQKPSSVLCCLEFKQPHEMGVIVSESEHLVRIQHELKSLSTFNRDIEVHGLLRSADGRYLALMTNLPEEGSYLLDQVADPLFDHAVLRFFADATERLHDDIHAKGYVHGDFKLSNVMVTDAGRASLIDLDNLQPIDSSGLADIRSTTFTPPEQRAPLQDGFRTRFGQSGDIFAVGLALFDAYAERDAKTQEMSAERASAAAAPLLRERADDIRANKALILHDMTSATGGFFEWRRRMLDGGFDAQRFARDTSMYGKSLRAMQQRAPALFQHWITSLSSDNAADRASLQPTRSLLRGLQQQPEALRTTKRVEHELREIAAESLTAFVAPALEHIAAQLREETR